MKKLLSVFLILMVLMVSAPAYASESSTAANFSDLQTAVSINENSEPTVLSDVFLMSSSSIYVTGMLNDLPIGTSIRADWYYNDMEPAYLIASAELTTVENTSPFHFSLSQPDNGFPSGAYEVQLYRDGKYQTSVYFTVSPAYFTDLATASSIDDDYLPVELTSDFSTLSPVVYATGIINDAPAGTVVSADWYYVTEDEQYTYIDSASMAIDYTTMSISFSLSKPDNGFLPGTYIVGIYIGNVLADIVPFMVE